MIELFFEFIWGVFKIILPYVFVFVFAIVAIGGVFGLICGAIGNLFSGKKNTGTYNEQWESRYDWEKINNNAQGYNHKNSSGQVDYTNYAVNTNHNTYSEKEDEDLTEFFTQEELDFLDSIDLDDKF